MIPTTRWRRRSPAGRQGFLDSPLAEVSLALVVVFAIGLMIVPPPTALLDVLLAANLSCSLALLLAVLQARDTRRFSSFPVVLLLTTLVRLSLNVSSTRLILVRADAGRVIHAFGAFVVQGNYVVGAVAFAILALVQYIVIAKGAERIAEVAARFALDGMPGKQMAIDAELRPGTLDALTARARRRDLGRESQFYGAMDGAMRFVRGDVIASIVIALVSVLAGLFVGVAQRGLPMVEALHRYGLLAIGDALVSQIPALVLSMAAGVLVSRASSEDGDARASLGATILVQVTQLPRALVAAACFTLILALVPGLPALPFLLLAAALAALSQWGTTDADRAEPSALVAPWGMAMSDDVGAALLRAGGRRQPDGVRAAVFASLGLALPPPRIEVDSALPPRSLVVLLHGVPAERTRVPEGLDEGGMAQWVDGQLVQALHRLAPEFVGLAETQARLDALELVGPALVRAVVPRRLSLAIVPRRLSLAIVAEVLRRLVGEGISVRDLRTILEGLAAAPSTEHDPVVLTERVRVHLRRAITDLVVGARGALRVVPLDRMLEDTIRRAIVAPPAPNGDDVNRAARLGLSPQAARDVVAAVKRALEGAHAGAADEGATAVLLVAADIRPYVRELIATPLPAARVVSAAELLPDTALQPSGAATLVGIE